MSEETQQGRGQAVECKLSDEQKLASPMRQVVFIRADGFYPLEIPEATIADNAECNPGTLRVEDAVTGEILWPNAEVSDAARHGVELPNSERGRRSRALTC